MVLATGSVRRGKGGEGMPSCNKTKMHFDDRRTAPFIPGAPGILVAGTLGCSGNWEKTRAKLKHKGESIRLAPASSQWESGEG